MLVYQATKGEFMDDVDRDVIADRITKAFEQRIHRANPREVEAWRNSMVWMYKVLNIEAIPSGCGVAIEFTVPYTSSRIDFLLTGRQDGTRDSAVIIELKQWQQLEAVPTKDGIVRTRFASGVQETAHPSYQAWSYARMIEDYNEAVRDTDISLVPCAYLHNYREKPAHDPLRDPVYLDYLRMAPAFCHGDALALRDFICKHITHADDGSVLYEIESGRLRPSKSLQDALAGMMAGNQEFVMIDDQKVVFEQAVALALEAREAEGKHVLIVRGGPGTGKSVVAFNLLVRLTGEEMTVQYVSKNAAPRHVYSKLLQGQHRATYIKSLFKGPGKYYQHKGAPFDALVVDEAHRLNEKSGLYGNEGENQIKELIAASRFTVFLIDESQRVTAKDIGTVLDIRRFAEQVGARVHEAELSSQFRCNGSDSYLVWLDDVLGIQAAEEPVASLDYDFRVFDDPSEMHAAIAMRNQAANKARVVAGYCWEWDSVGRANADCSDIVIDEHGYERSWNLNNTDTWAIDPQSVDQVGCVHTCQGLEFDYVGVIIGDDLRFENGRVLSDRTKRARSDKALNGINGKHDAERAERIADELIRNTYRVLMTRGMKGCYVYCTDSELARHLRDSVPRVPYPRPDAELSLAAEDHRED
ncbi:MAG: DNA/RNA helicase domain-containing protein [Coriobacteriia bacterium]